MPYIDDKNANSIIIRKKKKPQIRVQSFAKEAKIKEQTSRHNLKDTSALITSVGTSLYLGTISHTYRLVMGATRTHNE